MLMEPFHQSFKCHNFDRTKHKVYISFQLSCRVFLGHFAYKECFFPLNSSNDALIDHDGRGSFLEGCKKYCGAGWSMGQKPHESL